MRPVSTPSTYIVTYRCHYSGSLTCIHTNDSDECIEKFDEFVCLCCDVGGMVELWELMPDQLYCLVDSCHRIHQPPFMSKTFRPSCN